MAEGVKIDCHCGAPNIMDNFFKQNFLWHFKIGIIIIMTFQNGVKLTMTFKKLQVLLTQFLNVITSFTQNNLYGVC